MKSNFVVGDLLNYSYNGIEHKVIVEKFSFSYIVVSFLNKGINNVRFEKEHFERFKTENGNGIKIETNKIYKKTDDSRRKNSGSVQKFLIDWVIEVLKETMQPMSYKEIGNIIKQRGYKFPYRENENKTTIECSIHTRWFERVNNHKINDIKRVKNGVLQYVG